MKSEKFLMKENTKLKEKSKKLKVLVEENENCLKEMNVEKKDLIAKYGEETKKIERLKSFIDKFTLSS